MTAVQAAARRLWPQPLVGALCGVLGLLALVAAWRATPGGLPGAAGMGGGAASLCLVAVVAAYQFPLALRPKAKVYLTSVPYYLLVILAPPALAVAAGGMAALLGELSVRQARGNRAGDIASEGGRRALVLLGGVLVAHRGGVSPDVPALGVAALALWAGDIATAPLVLAPITGEAPMRIVGAVAREAWLTEGAQYLLGVLGALAAARAPWAPTLLVLPLALGYRALAAAQGARAEAEWAAGELRHEATHDGLTGLPNRALLRDRLGRALARRPRPGEAGEVGVGVLYVDLDRFKVVNDSLGHAAGDALLVAVAGRLVGCVRAGDTVARLGGDEFALLLDGLGEASQAVRTAERVIRALEAPVRLDGHDVVVGASIGIAVGALVATATTAADLLREADVALYRAKAGGRGRYAVFDAAMNAHALERLELEAELRRGLERGEFAVYYQPKVELATGRLAGLEALVRWRHPARGLVGPDAFIPLAEETGLIVPLGQWVLEEACRQARRWGAEGAEGAGGGPAVVVSVNLSARQFAQPALEEAVARALAMSGADAGQVQLEITEGVAMGNAEATVETLRRLKGLGVELAIDDFGTGYSSLAYLKRFPVDALKIDRAFVTGVRRETADASIVGAVVGLGRALGLAVVAEGVETAEEAAQVRALGCGQGQGYHFARPLPRAEAEALVVRAGAGAGGWYEHSIVARA